MFGRRRILFPAQGVETGEPVTPGPKILYDMLVDTYNVVTSYKLSDIHSDEETPWKKLTYTFSAPNTSLKVAMKTQLSIIQRNADVIYDEITHTVTDLDGYTTTKTSPLLCLIHAIDLGSNQIGREILLSDMVALDGIYENFPLMGSKLAIYDTDVSKFPYYKQNTIEVYENKIKIIGNILLNKDYFLVNMEQKKAMHFVFMG